MEAQALINNKYTQAKKLTGIKLAKVISFTKMIKLDQTPKRKPRQVKVISRRPVIFQDRFKRPNIEEIALDKLEAKKVKVLVKSTRVIRKPDMHKEVVRVVKGLPDLTKIDNMGKINEKNPLPKKLDRFWSDSVSQLTEERKEHHKKVVVKSISRRDSDKKAIFIFNSNLVETEKKIVRVITHIKGKTIQPELLVSPKTETANDQLNSHNIQTVKSEPAKKQSDHWSDCGQIFYTAGKAFGIASNLRTICLGTKSGVQNFMETGKVEEKLSKFQKETLMNIVKTNNLPQQLAADNSAPPVKRFPVGLNSKKSRMSGYFRPRIKRRVPAGVMGRR